MTAPAVLLPYQQRWVSDPAPVRICEKSRRIGLSWGMAAEASLTAAADATAGGMDVWYVGYNKDMAQEFIRDAGDWARAYGFAVSEMETYEEIFKDGDDEKAILAYRITFASGFRVSALSSRPSNLRGKQGLVVLDEAAFHDALGELIKAAMALLIWGGRVAIISTHDGVENPFNQLVLDCRAGKVPYSLHRITLDDALADGLFKRICLVQGKEWTPEAEAAWRQELVDFYREDADEELHCIPKSSGGSYFSRSLVESRMEEGIPILRYRVDDAFTQLADQVRWDHTQDWLEEHVKPVLEALNPRSRSYYGLDFGRSGDLTVLTPLVEDQGLHRRVPFVIELRNTPFKQQEQVLFYVVDHLPRFMAGANDARGNGQYLAEVAAQRYGSYRIREVMLSQEFYRENFPKYKAALEDGHVTLPRDADVLADHRAVKVDKGVPKVPDGAKTKGADGGQRHGDSAISCLLAWHANGLDIAPIEFQSTGETRAGFEMDDYMGGY